MTASPSWWSGPLETDDAASSPPAAESTPLEGIDLSERDAEQLLTRRVHILGLGSIGTVVAHSLRCLPNPPPITLISHRPEYYQAYKRGGRVIRLLNKQSGIHDEQGGFDVEVPEGVRDDGTTAWTYIADAPRGPAQPTHPLQEGERLASGEVFIYALIVAVKGPATVSALRSIKHRVDARTTICFMQNGLGQIDELNAQVFTDPARRPTYLLGIVHHGSHMAGDPCSVVHAGVGTIALGVYRDPDRYPLPGPGVAAAAAGDVAELTDAERRAHYPTDEELYASLSSRYLLRTLTRSPVLSCAAFPYLDLFQLQLEKLAGNVVLNPLTALLDVRNGELLRSAEISEVARLLLAETSLVMRGLPELQGVPGVQARFSARRLEQLVVALMQVTALNSSSMREDLRNGKYPEIGYINGYIVRRGDEQGIRCVLNHMVTQLVKGKHVLGPGERVPAHTRRIQSETDETGTVTLTDASTP